MEKPPPSSRRVAYLSAAGLILVAAGLWISVRFYSEASEMAQRAAYPPTGGLALDSGPDGFTKQGILKAYLVCFGTGVAVGGAICGGMALLAAGSAAGKKSDPGTGVAGGGS